METFLHRESELPIMNIISMTLKYKIATLKNLYWSLSWKRHSLVQITLFFEKAKFTPLKLPKNIDGENVSPTDIHK